MPEAEISPAGDVLVEGHHVGELQGFRFTPDASAGGEDARAVKAAAQKALGVEFDARAERFASGANGDFALGSDGTLRWIGVPVGTLVSAEDPLRPRLILLADEQLGGVQREKVAERAERFVRYQIDTLLKPLSDLRSADHLTGMARGVAFRLIENLGIINRRDIADDVKGLDQDARGALRRLGVRFGAYHIFLPALVKPAPAGMMTLLWALANDGKEKPGFGDVVHALSSGRTSVVVDPAFEKAFYRLAGFRILGRRAVRVDILERLADLIRPALSWRPGAGARPDAAFDGRAFMATAPMMSILGANADDMEEILKGLGYRAEPRAAADVQARLKAEDEAEAARQAARVAEADKPADDDSQPVAEAGPGEASADDTPTPSQEPSLHEASLADLPGQDFDLARPSDPHDGEGEPAAAEAIAENTSVLGEDGSDLGLTSPSMGEVAEQSEAGGGETSTEQSVDTDIVSGATAETVVENIAVLGDDGETPSAEPAVTASPEAEPAEPPKPILLWRPAGRFEGKGDGRPRQGERGERKPFVRNREGNAGASAQAPGERPEGARQPRADRKEFFRAARSPESRAPESRAPGDAANPPSDARPPRRDRQNDRASDRPDRRFEGKPGGRQNRDEGAGRQDRAPQRPREERPAVFDPDSPFAKLAALRDQLKK